MATNTTMNLFGMPYQFSWRVDPRFPEVSDNMGHRFATNIALQAPVLTLIPGKAQYMPGKGKNEKRGATQIFLESAFNEDFIHNLVDGNTPTDLRLYDFQIAYNEYMDYVNALCRAGAVYLDLQDSVMTAPNGDSWRRYDWRNYKWSKSQEKSGSGGGQGGGMRWEDGKDDPDTDSGLWDIGKNKSSFVQFYVDPDIGPTDSFSNSTGESQLAGAIQQPSTMNKELSFITGQALDETLLAGTTDAISAAAEAIIPNNGLGGRLSSWINLGAESVKGNNVVMPEIYQMSQRSKSYSISIHLKTPYGNKYSYYTDIYCPMMHALALVWPRAATANSYSEPFLVKGYIDGLLSVNLGIVEDCTVTRATDTLTTDGLPTEVDITLNIKDLYLDLSMTSVRNPRQFINNTSLAEYLGTACGVSLVNPRWGDRVKILTNNLSNYPSDALTSISGAIKETLYQDTMNFANKVAAVVGGRR